jgi:hypothetical protein
VDREEAALKYRGLVWSSVKTEYDEDGDGQTVHTAVIVYVWGTTPVLGTQQDIGTSRQFSVNFIPTEYIDEQQE